MILGDFVDGLFDIVVRRFGLAGVYDMDAMVFLSRAHIARHLVGVEHQDQLARVEAVIVGQDIHQALTGMLQAFTRDGLELLPGKDDVIAVH